MCLPSASQPVPIITMDSNCEVIYEGQQRVPSSIANVGKVVEAPEKASFEFHIILLILFFYLLIDGYVYSQNSTPTT